VVVEVGVGGEMGENKRVKEEGGGAHGHQWG